MTRTEPGTGVILLADDDASIRRVLSKVLEREGYEVRATDRVEPLMQWVEEGRGDAVVTDVSMPDGNAFDFIPQMIALRPELPIVVMSAQNTVTTAIRSAEVGAWEYLPKPFDMEELVGILKRAGSHQAASALAPGEEDLPLVGRSAAMQVVYKTLARLLSTELTVLITGESGTGKELVAQALHDYGTRRGGPFVALNMAAIPLELIESELFGHEKGAFTGATGKVAGKFAQARDGTLFLDEIGDMPMEAQTRLLRVLQRGEFTPVGGQHVETSNARIIAATHQALPDLIAANKFREDLYYRLQVAPINIPPLRDRLEDIPDLVVRFLSDHPQTKNKRLGDKALSALKRHSWPGNVRELKHLVERVAVLSSETVIPASAIQEELAFVPDRRQSDGLRSLAGDVDHHLGIHFGIHAPDLPPDGLYQQILPEVERPLLLRALDATDGNQLQAAKLLGINRNTLRKKIRELDISLSSGKK